MNNPQTWTPGKKLRRNFEAMGLHVWALQNANLIPHEVPAFAKTEDEARQISRISKECSI